MADDEEEKKKIPGFMSAILDGMPKGVKTVAFSILALPIVLALGALILQINIGKIIDRLVDMEFERHKAEMQSSYQHNHHSKADLEEMKRWICTHQSEKPPEFCHEL